METTRTTIRQALGVTLEKEEVKRGDLVVDTVYILTPPGDEVGLIYSNLAEADAAYLLALSAQA